MNDLDNVKPLQPDQSDPAFDFLAEDDPILVAFAEEYRRLSKLLAPTEADFEALEAILELSQFDTALCHLIETVDEEVK